MRGDVLVLYIARPLAAVSMTISAMLIHARGSQMNYLRYDSIEK